MIIQIPQGLLRGASYTASPNWDERPLDTLIELVVIHCISLPPGEFGTGAIHHFFANQLDHSKHLYFEALKQMRVSAHLLIDRAGIITQFVPFSKRAWHAGNSFFKGRENCNDFSIGIELEGTDETPYEAVQYQSLTQILAVLIKTYPTKIWVKD